MKKVILAVAIGLASIGAQPAANTKPLDGREYANAIAMVYPDENALLRGACDDEAPYLTREYATAAAILNEWNGPFRLRDLAAWLQQNHINGRLCVSEMVWDSGDRNFPHLPDGFKKLAIGLRTAEGRAPSDRSDYFAVVAVDAALTADHVEAILKEAPKAENGGGPIAYDIRPTVFPSSFFIRDK